MRRRVRRLLAIMRERYSQTGNPLAALWFALRYVLVKLPTMTAQLQASRTTALVASEVRETRAQRPEGPPQLAVKLTGGLGDGLVVARFLRDFAAQCGPVVFDVFSLHPEQAIWVFSGVDGLRACHHEVVFDAVMSDYDVALRVNQFVVVQDNLLDWRALMRWPRLLRVVTAITRYRPKIDVFVERYPYMDNFLAQQAIYANRTRADFLHAMAGLTYGGDQQSLLSGQGVPASFGLTPGRYITVNNGFDADFIISGKRATKCYPHFDAVIRLLRKSWPDLPFVQIGARTSDPLPSVDLDLVGKTTLPVAAGLLAGALLHIDNEGGLVHLARSLGVVSAVVFGPTPAAYFGYAANINIEPPICGGCWWINQTWMDQCPRQFPEARCMSEQPPAVVAAKITAYLEAMEGMTELGAKLGGAPASPIAALVAGDD